MPIRTASLTKQIQKNGARLHLAMASRVHSKGADQPPSEQEQALLTERRLLEEANAKRKTQPRLARPTAAQAMKEAKAAKPPKAPKAPKAAKASKEPKEAKKAGKDNKPTRAEKSTKKAENLEAAKKASKKSAKT